MATTDKISYGTYTTLAMTSAASMVNSQTVGAQSIRVSNWATLADDYEVLIDFAAFPATAPNNDKAIYVYVCPWISTDGGTTWIAGGDLGTTTLPSGTDAAATIALPPNLKGPYVLNYTTQAQPIHGMFTLSSMMGGIIYDGWSLVLINYTGATTSAAPVFSYIPITYTNS